MDDNKEYMREWILEWISRWGTDWVQYEKANLEMVTTPHFTKQEQLGYLEIEQSANRLELKIRLTPKAIEFLRGGVEIEKGRSPVKEGMNHVVKGMNAYDAGQIVGGAGVAGVDSTKEERIRNEIQFLNEMKAHKYMLQAHRDYLTALSASENQPK